MAEKKEASSTKMPSEMLTAHLLALLKNWSGYGYELAKKLEDAGYGGYNSGTLYRTLRQMEKTGLISSLWDTSTDGPARRIYSVTKTGSLFLTNWFTLLDMHKAALNSFMKMAENVTEPGDKSSNGKEKNVES
ncbi:MAG: poly-beta-hydroxybutyrate-responsive repressor [Gammaproteobacteria bacterium]|nr:MAG: poly-beta-hydroxybutyrate-responsive repressor [Gammaproteobacteria bacterium]RLA51673.1 MAG: poly-beta-hydroxybutyrate-responsive repressor [Gammaproteobacteria bacterium]